MGEEAGPPPTNTVCGIDSWGNVLPAADDAIAVGVYPLQTVPAPGSPEQRDDGGDSTPTTYNILPIMVDQLRQPVWLPSGTGGCQTALDSICPNIALPRNHSLAFSEYYCPATSCGPSRAAMLTGLYPQQTAFFCSPGHYGQQDLNPGYDTYGTALSGLGYDCTWIGKWHVGGASSLPENYGLSSAPLHNYNLPNSGLSSPLDPIGHENEGNNAQASTFGFTTGGTAGGMTAPPGTQVSDPGITQAFKSYWTNYLGRSSAPALNLPDSGPVASNVIESLLRALHYAGPARCPIPRVDRHPFGVAIYNRSRECRPSLNL